MPIESQGFIKKFGEAQKYGIADTVLDKLGKDYTLALRTGNCVLFLTGLPFSGSTLKDTSHLGNDSTISGATWTQLSSGLWVLAFASGNYISKASFVNLPTGSQARSGELWVKDTWATGRYSCFLGYGQDANYKACWFSDGGGTTHYLSLFGYNSDHESTTAIPNGVWTHVAFSYTGTTSLLYMNGVLVSTKSNHTTFNTTNSTFYIGIRQDLDASSRLVGQLALPRYYNAVIPVANFLQHYNQERHLFGV